MHLGEGHLTVGCAVHAATALALGAGVGWLLARDAGTVLRRMSAAAGAALLLAVMWFGLAEAVHHALLLFTPRAEQVERLTQALTLLALAAIAGYVVLRLRPRAGLDG